MGCALCLKDQPLRLSHVIPEFMFTPLYDEKHRFHILSTTDQRYPSTAQKGIRERLLCELCEQKFGRYERYVSHVFSGAEPVQAREEGNLVHIAGLKYKPFRLFGLSILWRAAVAQDSMYSKVKLGLHQEALRQKLIREDPGPPSRYGFFLSPLLLGERDVKDLIVKPTRARLGTNMCYRFVFGGLIWVFVVSSHPAPKAFQQAFLNEEGKMMMLKSQLPDVTFIINALNELLRVEK